MSLNGSLQEKIEHWFAQGAEAVGNKEAEAAFGELRSSLEAGSLRSAERMAGGTVVVSAC